MINNFRAVGIFSTFRNSLTYVERNPLIDSFNQVCYLQIIPDNYYAVMNLLEQALARTNNTVIEEKDGITIDKSFAFASRKRGRVALSTVSNNTVQFNDKPNNEMDRPSAETLYWRYISFFLCTAAHYG